MARKLSDKQRKAIQNSDLGPTALADKYKVSRQTIYRVRSEAKEEMQAPTQSPFREWGSSGLRRFGGSISEDYHRSWRNIQDMVPLVQEMLDHPVVGAMSFAVEMAMRAADWSVIPAAETPQDAEAAEFLESCMDDMSQSFDDHITQAISMVWYGFSPFEIVYKRRTGMAGKSMSKYDDGRIGWRKFAFRSQDTLSPGKEWEFDDHGGIQGMNQTDPVTGNSVFIPIEKMLLYRTTAAKNNPQGRSALRSAYIPYYYSKNMAEIEGISAERMGAGLPIAYLGGGTSVNPNDTNSDFEFAKSIVRDIRADEQSGIVVPYQKQTADGKGVLIELLSPPSRGIVDFDQVITRYNQQIAQTAMAQFIFLGMTKIGTQALAGELIDFFSMAIAGWTESVQETLNRFAVPRLFLLNAFDSLTDLPQFEVTPAGKTDIGQLMEGIERAASVGLITPDEGTERTVRNLLGLPQQDTPEAGQDLDEVDEPKDEPEEPRGDMDTGDEEFTYRPKIERLDKLSMFANEAIDELRSMTQPQSGPMEVHVHNEMKQPDVFIETATPDINIHNEQPEVKVDIAPQEVHIHNEQAEAMAAPIPDYLVEPMNITVEAELVQPDDVLETETAVERNKEGLIARTIRKTLRKNKDEPETMAAEPTTVYRKPGQPVNIQLQTKIKKPQEVIETETIVNRDKRLGIVDRIMSMRKKKTDE